MSVTIEDKIELFSKLIFGNIEAYSSDKRQMLAEAHKKELEALELEVESRKNELMETAVIKAEREKVKLIAHAKNQQQQLLVHQKQQTMQNVILRLHELAEAYTNTQEYKQYMTGNFESVINALDKSKQITFYAMEKDLPLCKEIVEELLIKTNKQIKYEIKKASSNIIGGIIAEDMESLLQIDLTIKAIIDDNKDKVGAAITRRYNEVSSL